MDAAVPAQKSHRPSRNKKKNSKSNASARQAVAKPGAFARRVRLSADRAEKRAPNPALPVDRSGGDAAPRVVAVVGPSAVGKSTVIRNLIKHYSKRNVPIISGPITIVAGRRKRITFVEVGDDLSSMIDAAKVADLVLLVIDASFGFEMETFEFLNIASAHGMPKVMAVLTHLDKLRDGKQVRRAKKSMKDRIWAELYDGAKVFYLSGITTSGDYLSREILNLARFISVTKYSHIKWRADHPYILADRVEDVTPVALPANANRTVVAYGYLRGTPLRTTAGEWHVHLAGVGDLAAKNIEILSDPCPTPDGHLQTGAGSSATPSEQLKPKRKVSERDRVVYAPMAPEVDGISYDRDAVYINLNRENIRFSEETALVADGKESSKIDAFDGNESSDGEGEKMVKHLQMTATSTIDESLKHATLQLISGGRHLISDNFSNGHRRRRVEFADVSDDDTPKQVPQRESPEVEADAEREKRCQKKTLITEAYSVARGDKPVSRGGPASTEERSSQPNESQSTDDEFHNGFPSEEPTNDEERASQEWRGRTLVKASRRLRRTLSPSKALTKHIYGIDASSSTAGAEDDRVVKGLSTSNTSADDEGDEAFFTPKRRSPSEGQILASVSSAVLDDLTRRMPQASKNWIASEDICSALKHNRFGTGQSTWMNASTGASDPIDGDFEDLEPAEAGKDVSAGGEDESSESDIEEIRGEKIKQKQEFDAEWDTRATSNEITEEDGDPSSPALSHGREGSSGRKRRELTEGFQDQRMLDRNRLEKAKSEVFNGLGAEEQLLLEGIQPGNYVRLELQDVPVEFVKFFNPKYPVILGGLKRSDDSGQVFLRARIRRHRFLRGVLKSNDPIIFSIGWRRFQSIPVYDNEDQGGRHRFLKYTPDYLHCNSTFWGPSVAPGAGVIMCKSLERNRGGFRIAGSGHVTEVDTSCEIVKKLKLIGEPLKVHRNTAFIKGMFNSELEVSKYIGASIRTVSGIRGTIKKAISEGAQRGSLDRDIAKSPAGSFRGGFEDKILLSDIVFLRAWVPVEPTRFCHIATTMLDKERTGNGAWRMRTIREVRQSRELSIPLQKDSIYRPIERARPKFTPLKISRKLESSLPYASKPKNFAAKSVYKDQSGRKATVVAERAVVMEKKERQEQSLLQAVYTIRNERSKRRKEANDRRLTRRKHEWKREEEKRAKLRSDKRKRQFALEGAREAHDSKRTRTVKSE